MMFARLSHFAHRILGAADTMASAARVAGAIDRGAAPTARDLKRLGIAPQAFATIHLA